MKYQSLLIGLLLSVCQVFGQARPYLVKDINVGSGSSIRFGVTGNAGMSPSELSHNFCVFKGYLYFFASDGSKISLWRSDGTRQGTSIFLSFTYATSISGDEFGGLIANDNYLFFFANTTTTGTELWRTDGTTDGTGLVRDFNPGTASGILSANYQAVLGAENYIYFTARSSGNIGNSSNELWRTDGSGAGTSVIRPRIGNNTATTVSALMRFKEKIYFTANLSTTGSELWVTDGTQNNTQLFKEFGEGNISGPAFLGQYNFGSVATTNHLYFVDTRRLYRTDGTPDGTVLVKELSSNTDVFSASSSLGVPSNLTAIDNIVYFLTSTRLTGVGGNANVGAIWRSDGTEEGTRLVSNTSVERPERVFGLKNSFLLLGSLNGNQSNPAIQSGLWGASASQAVPLLITSRVGRAIDVGPDNTYLNYNNNAVFIAQGPNQDFYGWRTDGTSGETDTLFSLTPASGTYLCGIVNDIVLYYANSTDPNVGWELFAAPISIKPSNCTVSVTIEAPNLRIPCNGGSVALNAVAANGSGPFLYRWSKGDSSTFIATSQSLVAKERGIYKVTVVDGRGCTSAPSSVEVIQPMMPSLRIGGTPSVCSNVGSTLRAEIGGGKAPFTYQWKLADVELSSKVDTLRIVAGGQYALSIVDSEGCFISTIANVSEDNVRPTVTGTLGFCPNQSTTLTATVQGGVAPLTYQWKKDTVNVGTNLNTYTVNTAGNLTVVVKDARGCIGTSPVASIEAFTLPPATISATKTQIMPNETTILTANIGTGLSYQWQQNNNSIANATTNTYSTSQAGTYRVLVTRTGCVATSNEITVGIITSIEPITAEMTLEISPNPVANVCHIKLLMPQAAAVSFQLTDASGRVLQEWKAPQPSKLHQSTLSVASLRAGSYFIQAQTGEKRLAKKLLKID
ncbi:T9SS type A sorting domain-containing protein [Runella sp. MFBS21]|uniref:T9SS type A sorting domain-containing protein n=1 Tax=Runella sp. MFBS21 TaxID=3034018 RepID=UPI0023FA1506|nr:T9SS type A sorting domain-containing protein [Runella sp. MFBS21]MDF7817335.1 T9SS type A sorting domain-containing protein [Runella sp. MFBS21]